MGFEQPSTFNASGAGRLIFEAAWAPHFLRLYRYTGDHAFLTYARNAVVGRWSNYPGYYLLGHTDLPQDPRYPLTGPDVTDFYYHHIPAHLAWTIDYLVTEAEVLSDGRIRFPSQRQHGYAYFDSRIFGHAPGRVFDDPAAWLIFRRGLVTLDNVQINYLLAHGRDGLHVILTNQSHQEQKVTVSLSPRTLKLDPARAVTGRLQLGAGEPTELTVQQGRATIAIPARGLAVLTVPEARLEMSTPRQSEPRKPPQGESILTLKDPVAQTRAAALQMDAGSWDAYVWSSASPAQAQAATLHYTTGGPWQTTEARQYPFEFSIPMKDEKAILHFRVELTRPDGKIVAGPEGRLTLRP